MMNTQILKKTSKYSKEVSKESLLKEIPKFHVVLCTLKKLKGAFDNLYDTAIIISGNEDFVDSIKIDNIMDKIVKDNKR